MKRFTINKKEYNAKPFDFNLICDLEDMGVSVADIARKPIATVRAYFALCVNGGKEVAGKELEEHLKNGGSLEDIMSVMSAEMDESDFFRSLAKNAEEEASKSQSKKK